jgi:hypothetical protein
LRRSSAGVCGRNIGATILHVAFPIAVLLLATMPQN